jgi:hypothetical protein
MLEIDARVAFAQHRAARAEHGQSTAPIALFVRDGRVRRDAGVTRLPKHDPATEPNGTFFTASITPDPLKEFVAVGEFLDSRHGGDVDRKFRTAIGSKLFADFR